MTCKTCKKAPNFTSQFTLKYLRGLRICGCFVRRSRCVGVGGCVGEGLWGVGWGTGRFSVRVRRVCRLVMGRR